MPVSAGRGPRTIREAAEPCPSAASAFHARVAIGGLLPDTIRAVTHANDQGIGIGRGGERIICEDQFARIRGGDGARSIIDARPSFAISPRAQVYDVMRPAVPIALIRGIGAPRARVRIGGYVPVATTYEVKLLGPSGPESSLRLSS